jgi:hypothetical protein
VNLKPDNQNLERYASHLDAYSNTARFPSPFWVITNFLTDRLAPPFMERVIAKHLAKVEFMEIERLLQRSERNILFGAGAPGNLASGTS